MLSKSQKLRAPQPAASRGPLRHEAGSMSCEPGRDPREGEMLARVSRCQAQAHAAEARHRSRARFRPDAPHRTRALRAPVAVDAHDELRHGLQHARYARGGRALLPACARSRARAFRSQHGASRPTWSARPVASCAMFLRWQSPALRRRQLRSMARRVALPAATVGCRPSGLRRRSLASRSAPSRPFTGVSAMRARGAPPEPLARGTKPARKMRPLRGTRPSHRARR